MPRVAREKSRTGIYHVILRGINGQIIFEDEEDYLKFYETLEVCKDKSDFEIYAYCFMSNHIHLLIKEGSEDLGIAFRRIGASYVYWYNWKYSRRGHLFQDRYKSEVVETDRYLLTVVRYIHRNPLKAGMVKGLADYQWSSYGEYMHKRGICDTRFILDLFSKDKGEAEKEFEIFNLQNNNDKCLSYSDNLRLNDAEATDIIKIVSGVNNLSELQGLAKIKRDDAIRKCREQGVSIRQLERLTGVSYGIIRSV